MNRIIVEVAIPTRLDRYLRRLYPVFTQGVIEKMLRTGKITLNNNKVQNNTRVVNGDEILILSEHKSEIISVEKIVSSKATINLADKLLNKYLLYQDDDLIIINKPSSLATQGGSKINLSIQDALNFLNNNQKYDFKLVHRLDKDTSGILLIAKNYLAAYQLGKAFQEKIIQKTYFAVVHGTPVKQSGVIEGLIGKDRGGVYETVKNDIDGGKLAITHYKVLSSTDDEKVSLIEFMPFTGRMHQIRVHALKIGCQIVGDKKYGNIKELQNCKNMLLHSREVNIPEIVLGREITAVAPIPKYFTKFIVDSGLSHFKSLIL